MLNAAEPQLHKANVDEQMNGPSEIKACSGPRDNSASDSGSRRTGSTASSKQVGNYGEGSRPQRRPRVAAQD